MTIVQLVALDEPSERFEQLKRLTVGDHGVKARRQAVFNASRARDENHAQVLLDELKRLRDRPTVGFHEKVLVEHSGVDSVVYRDSNSLVGGKRFDDAKIVLAQKPAQWIVAAVNEQKEGALGRRLGGILAPHRDILREFPRAQESLRPKFQQLCFREGALFIGKPASASQVTACHS